VQSSVLQEEVTDDEVVPQVLSEPEMKKKFADAQKFKRIKADDVNTFDEFVDEIDDPNIFFQIE